MKVRCPNCQTVTEVQPDGAVRCPSCGKSGRLPAPGLKTVPPAHGIACPGCGKHVDVPATGAFTCPSCGTQGQQAVRYSALGQVPATAFFTNPDPARPSPSTNAAFPEFASSRPEAPRIQEQAFFARPAPKTEPHFLLRTARSPFRQAGFLLGIGAATVFVAQASFVYQLVLGAPIFEEALKFGLALLIALAASVPVRSMGAGLARAGLALVLGGILFGVLLGWGLGVLPSAAAGGGAFVVGCVVPAMASSGSRTLAWLYRIPVALVVGAGFGVLEHFVTYVEESTFSFVWRTAFHSLSTGVSMVAWSLLEPHSDPRRRWAATLPATAVHYLNNAGALLMFPLLLAGMPESVAEAWSYGLTLLLPVLAVVLVAWKAPLERLGFALARRIPA